MTVQVLSIHVWLVVVRMDNVDTEYFHYYSCFLGGQYYYVNSLRSHVYFLFGRPEQEPKNGSLTGMK